MRPLLRRLLLCLMVLALPLQGLAAAARLHCGGAASPLQVGQQHATVHAHGPHHGHDAHHAHAEHPAHAALFSTDARHPSDAAERADAAAHDVADASGASQAGHSCSACAACHAGVGLPAAVTLVPGIDACDSVSPLAPQPAASFIASAPERPPRTHLA